MKDNHFCQLMDGMPFGAGVIANSQIGLIWLWKLLAIMIGSQWLIKTVNKVWISNRKIT
jgi:hypothetical protein